MPIDPVSASDPLAASADPVAANVAALAALFPQAVAEGRVDMDALRALLGDAVAEGDERYGLSWSGKAVARRHALTPTLATLRPAPGDSVDWDATRNIVVEGDNLEVLKCLAKSYAGKVKLIYIDPPYNTGNDFVYPDDYREPLANYLKRSGQAGEDGVRNTSNPEGSGRFHTDWLNMMYPRLMLAREMLSRDGAIFVSCDDNELHHLRILMNDVFGPERFIASITAVTNMKGRNDKAHISPTHEYLVFYGTENFESFGLPLTIEQRAAFDRLDEFGRPYLMRDLRKRGGPDRREDRPNMFFPIYWNESTGECSLKRTGESDVEILPKKGDGSDGRWRWGKETVERHIRWIEGRRSSRSERLDARHRVYLNQSVTVDGQSDSIDEAEDDEEGGFERTSKPKSIWIGGELSSDSGNRALKGMLAAAIFDFPKSVDLIQRTIQIAATPSSLILDFFAGSGTTGHAVMAQNAADGGNRRFILVQLPEPLDPGNKDQKTAADFCDSIAKPRTIAELTKERLRRAGARVRADNPGAVIDTGFRAYRLAASNLKVWQPGADLEADLLDAADNLIPGRTEADLLVELLLKRGIDLCEPVETRVIAGRAVHAFGGGVLVVCLGAVTMADAGPLGDGIADWLEALDPPAPALVYFRDTGFSGDDAKLNLDAILRQRLIDRGHGPDGAPLPPLLEKDGVRSI